MLDDLFKRPRHLVQQSVEHILKKMLKLFKWTSKPLFFPFFFQFFPGSPSRLTAIGCYRDRASSQRIFSTLYQQVQVRWWWPDIDTIIKTCTDAAVARGYRIFSIQNLRECRWGPNAERDYTKYGHGWYCYRGVGWYDSGSVYRVQAPAPG